MELFTVNNLINFNVNQINNKYNIDQYYYWTIIFTNDNNVDISIFTENEWNKLKVFNECFTERRNLELNNDDNSLNCEQTLRYKNKIHWFDDNMEKSFKITFNKLEFDYGNEDEIVSNIKVLMKSNDVTTNKLRKWIILNYQILNKHYVELTN
jgi:hypothetical protein